MIASASIELTTRIDVRVPLWQLVSFCAIESYSHAATSKCDSDALPPQNRTISNTIVLNNCILPGVFENFLNARATCSQSDLVANASRANAQR